MPTRSNRKQQILEAFAFMLESQPGNRITTAKLAEHVGVSEAALYRHQTKHKPNLKKPLSRHVHRLRRL